MTYYITASIKNIDDKKIIIKTDNIKSAFSVENKLLNLNAEISNIRMTKNKPRFDKTKIKHQINTIEEIKDIEQSSSIKISSAYI